MAEGRIVGPSSRPSMGGSKRASSWRSMAQITSQTAAAGQAVVITKTDGQQFYVSVIGGGSIQATPAPGDGST